LTAEKLPDEAFPYYEAYPMVDTQWTLPEIFDKGIALFRLPLIFSQILIPQIMKKLMQKKEMKMLQRNLD